MFVITGGTMFLLPQLAMEKSTLLAGALLMVAGAVCAAGALLTLFAVWLARRANKQEPVTQS